MEHKCAECVLQKAQGGNCPIFNADMTNGIGCPFFKTELNICDVCGQPMIEEGILQKGVIEYDPDNNDYVMMCAKCGSADPCTTCRYHDGCRFEKDTSCQEPPYIMVQQRQGNAIIQTQQLNPKRVEATCRQGCPCFWEDGLDDGNFCLGKMGCGCRSFKLKRR